MAMAALPGNFIGISVASRMPASLKTHGMSIATPSIHSGLPQSLGPSRYNCDVDTKETYSSGGVGIPASGGGMR
jgi:hypothetical protein